MKTHGRITHWNDEKGYGFITPAAGAKQVFFHVRDFRGRGERPAVDRIVSFQLSEDRQGRPCAARVTPAGAEVGSMRRNYRLLIMAGALLFLLVVGLAVLGGFQPPALLGFYLIASALTFLVYAMDKSAAESGGRRMREVHLHLLALIGGWPGAMLAQQILRHKSVKAEFRLVFWITVALNVAVFLWLFTSSGAQFLHELLNSV